MIAKGVRFNAIKKKAGRYLGTMIFSFTMPCPSCKNTILIKTDPKSCEYLLVAGCVRYSENQEEFQEDVNKIQTPEEGEALNRNPFLKLETQKVDLVKAEQKKPLLKLIFDKKRIFEDDFSVNQTLRRKLKMDKNVVKKEENESKAKALDIRLLPVTDEDRVK
jgi:coiled-coil domain-containing protein 130